MLTNPNLETKGNTIKEDPPTKYVSSLNIQSSDSNIVNFYF